MPMYRVPVHKVIGATIDFEAANADEAYEAVLKIAQEIKDTIVIREDIEELPKKKRKWRPAKSKDWICPEHGLMLVECQRYTEDKKTGEKKRRGWYYGCPQYHECQWSISPETGKCPTKYDEE